MYDTAIEEVGHTGLLHEVYSLPVRPAWLTLNEDVTA